MRPFSFALYLDSNQNHLLRFPCSCELLTNKHLKNTFIYFLIMIRKNQIFLFNSAWQVDAFHSLNTLTIITITLYTIHRYIMHNGVIWWKSKNFGGIFIFRQLKRVYFCAVLTKTALPYSR